MRRKDDAFWVDEIEKIRLWAHAIHARYVPDLNKDLLLAIQDMAQLNSWKHSAVVEPTASYLV